MDDVHVLELARSVGMRGMVFKSQFWPTMGRTYYLEVPGIEAIGSITLNPLAGGLNPWVVEAAASQGARVVWMPTWSSACRSSSAFNQFMKTWFPSLTVGGGIDTIDSSGQLLPETRSIISLAKEMGLVLCTGHISTQESLAMAQEAERIGFTKLVFTHPFSNSIRATVDEIKEMTERGGYVEMCASNVFYGHEMDRFVEFIADVGPDHCILSSDVFGEWAPAAPEYLRMFVGRLLLAGIGEDAVSVMFRDNPARLLDLASNQ